MLFNSIEFLVFFPLVVGVTFALPPRARQLFLLAASYAFYMAWEPAYAGLLLFSTVVDWRAALGMEGATIGRRRALLALSLTVNLGLLFSFKYYNLINGTFTAFADRLGVNWPLPESNLLLPVGISFYTFQTLAYTIDVYRGTEKAEPRFALFALYVSYFPQLVAGPIERSGRLLPQLDAPQAFDWDRLASGLRWILWGFFKKCVVADRLGPIVDTIYGAPAEFSGPAMVLATLLFGYQVYCDFSGYSDIAVGTARILGVDLMRNFDQPHLARSLSEFWSRWHISLMSWFRDYVFFPLGGSRHGRFRTARNLLVVFGLSGLWHGADWSFLAWGLLSGLTVVLTVSTQNLRERVARATGLVRVPRLRAVGQVATTIALAYSCFPFFRATNLSHALQVYGRMPVGWTGLGDPVALTYFLKHLDVDPLLFVGTLVLVPLTELVEYAQRHRHTWAPGPVWARWASDYALLFGVLLLGRFDKNAFFYFQF